MGSRVEYVVKLECGEEPEQVELLGTCGVTGNEIMLRPNKYSEPVQHQDILCDGAR